MTRGAIRFAWSDAWLLYSIGLAIRGGRNSLKDVIFAGDAVNRAVFTPQELRRGTAKLTAAGLAREQDGIFRLEESGEQLMVRAEQAGDSLWDQVTEIARLLDAVPYEEWDEPGYEDPAWPYPGLSDEIVAAASAEYSSEVKSILEE
jgi:hypothetical protein